MRVIWDGKINSLPLWIDTECQNSFCTRNAICHWHTSACPSVTTVSVAVKWCHFLTQMGVVHSIFNSKGFNFVTLRQISKIVAMRAETILNLVFKFQLDCALFHGEAAGTWESEKRRKRKNKAFTITTERLLSRHTHNNNSDWWNLHPSHRQHRQPLYYGDHLKKRKSKKTKK